MPEKQIQISRDGVILGKMTESEAVELLQLGLLKASDQFAGDGLSDWKSLAEIQVRLQSSRSEATWLGRTKRSLSTAGTAVANAAGEWTGKARNLAGSTRAGAVNVADKLLSGFIPQIKAIVSGLVQTKPFQALRSGVSDDQLMLKVFGAAYDCLPKPVCRFVSEQHFVTFCMKHRAQMLRREVPESGNPD